MRTQKTGVIETRQLSSTLLTTPQRITTQLADGRGITDALARQHEGEDLTRSFLANEPRLSMLDVPKL